MSTTTSKWFYKAQAEVAEELKKRFEHQSCNWQVVTKNRIIEHYTCYEKETDFSNPQTIVVTLTKHSSNTVSVQIAVLGETQIFHVSP